MIPSGWYFCAESRDIKSGGLKSLKLFGKKWVLWRGESGHVRLSTAICPHLGSDLSKLGQVKGDHLVCFSHRYTYDLGGNCIGTGFKTLPCLTQGVLKNLPICEKEGFILAWYDAQGREPTWQMDPRIFEPSSHFVRSNFMFKVSVETLNEDNFDVGHLYQWHNVRNVKTTPVEIDGPTISICHRFTRHSILFKNPLKPPFNIFSKSIEARYSSTLHGHGLTDSFIDIFNFRIRLRDMIWCTPIDENTTLYTTFLKILDPEPGRSYTKRLLDIVMRPLIFRFSLLRLRWEHQYEGHGFWEKQTRIENPILTESERLLIEPYRQWSQQFI